MWLPPPSRRSLSPLLAAAAEPPFALSSSRRRAAALPGGFHLIAARLRTPFPSLRLHFPPLSPLSSSKEGRRFAPVKKWSGSLPLLVLGNM